MADTTATLGIAFESIGADKVKGLSAASREMRKAGAPIVKLTPEMIEAGVRELYRCIPMDIARPVLEESSVVKRVVCAVLGARTLP
jgi:hypothetical protein